jgi:serine protease Do
MRALRGLVLLAGFATTLPIAKGEEPDYRKLLEAVEAQLKETAATAGPSIACVVVSRSDFYPKPVNPNNTPGKLGGFDPREFLKNDPTNKQRAELAQSLNLADPNTVPDHGYAGGVVIDPGYVLTPYHVIDGAKRVYVYLPGKHGSYADIHAADARSDLAILKLLNPPARMTAIKFADVKTYGRNPTVYPGKLCVLMANPYSSTFGLKEPSAGFGSITGVRHRIPRKDPQQSVPSRYTEYAPLLEYDVKLNSAVSGGVLLNLDGEMIGFTNAAATAYGDVIGAGYAIPADSYFRRVVDVLRKGEEVEYGFLGVRPADAGGTTIDTIPGGPAAVAGLQNRDVIKKVDGIPVGDFNDLLLHIGNALAGSKVNITVSRFGRELDFDVTLTKFMHSEPFIASVRPEPVFGLRVEYSSILQQRPPKQPMFKEDSAIPAAVWVREVAPNSPAAEKFKTLGDEPTRWLIKDVNGEAVKTPSEFYKAAKGQEKVKLTLVDANNPDHRKELTLP